MTQKSNENAEAHNGSSGQVLSDNAQQFRALLRASADVEYRMNPDWTEVRSLDGRTCIADTQEPNKTWLDTHIHPDDLACVRTAIAEAIRTKSTFRREHRLLNEDGSLTWTSSWAIPILDESGKIKEWFGIASDITERKQNEQAFQQLNVELELRIEKRTIQLSRRARQLRHLTWNLTQAVEQERRRIADVLHDNQQQLLAAAKLPLATLDSGTDETVKRAAAKAEALIDEAIECARSLTDELSPPVLYHGGLEPAIHWLADWMLAKHGLQVRIDMGPHAEPETEDTRVLLFRCTRELLFNVVKHAGVKDAEVRLRERNAHTEITVSDQGAGFDPQDIDRDADSNDGFGLFAIRERMDLLGGKLEIDSAPGQGSRFLLRAPQAPPPRRPATNASKDA